MQEEAVKIILGATEISMKSLAEIIKAVIHNRNAIKHGEQDLKSLNKQNRQMDSVKITDKDIKAFRRQLNKHQVDFSILKDKKTNNYTIYFKGQDADRIYQSLEKCIKDYVKEDPKKQGKSDPRKDTERGPDHPDPSGTKRESERKEENAHEPPDPGAKKAGKEKRPMDEVFRDAEAEAKRRAAQKASEKEKDIGRKPGRTKDRGMEK